jgi:hypothetical protein
VATKKRQKILLPSSFVAVVGYGIRNTGKYIVVYDEPT